MSVQYDEKLPPHNYEYAEKYLGETKDSRDKCLSEIYKWFYQLRAERVEWFTDRNPLNPEIEELLDLGLFLPLDSKDVNNYQVFIIRTGVHNPHKHDQNDVLKVMKMVLDVVLYLDETISIYGTVAIFDMKGVTLRHGLQMTPTIIKRAVYCWENYACKVKKLEFINAPKHVNFVLDIFLKCMSKKLAARVSVTRGPSTVEANLPKDIGGNGPTYDELTKHWKQKTQEKAKWFAEQEQYKMILEK
ncbi:retinol-binding protein pinta isoform X2 [Contarinia nasturtii]|uniref:retinol-binding protein pinta isoform X2 n=1 Tax=Contarinia nasturtii TaxID=265458 RepID=UPI0012D418A5|nr:retinol-binding protein pinta isoform X2 [Contarinia nasturtii]